jgi:hypothetical protein
MYFRVLAPSGAHGSRQPDRADVFYYIAFLPKVNHKKALLRQHGKEHVKLASQTGLIKRDRPKDVREMTGRRMLEGQSAKES